MRKIKGLECILLVDDQEVTHFLNKLLIKKADIDVHVQSAYDGLEAIEYLTSQGKYSEEELPKPGIIFLDLNMPRMDGWEFIEKFKDLQIDKITNIVLITLLTTSASHYDIEKAKEFSEVNGFITKPLTLNKMKEIINENFDPNFN